MAEFQSIFKRYETKYMVTREQRAHILNTAGDRLAKDKFFESTVCSIYYDTPSSLLIRTSLDKPAYKEKLRLRSYGVPTLESTVFLEIKKKYSGVVYKRRASMELAKAYEFLEGHVKPDSQIERELDWILKEYGTLEPAAFVSYDRTSFCGTEDTELRITFDSNITYREDTLRLERGVFGDKLIDEEQFIMEVKSPYAVPLWFAHELDGLRLFPTSFSKYGTGYTRGNTRAFHAYDAYREAAVEAQTDDSVHAYAVGAHSYS